MELVGEGCLLWGEGGKKTKMRTRGQDKDAPFCGASLCLGPALETFLQLIQQEFGGYRAAWDQSPGRAQRQGLLVTWGHPRSVLPTNWLCPPLPLCRGTPVPQSGPTSATLTHLQTACHLSCFECSVLALLPTPQRLPLPARFPMVHPYHRDRKCGDGNPSPVTIPHKHARFAKHLPVGDSIAISFTQRHKQAQRAQ